jgi:hypothetical protein
MLFNMSGLLTKHAARRSGTYLEDEIARMAMNSF